MAPRDIVGYGLTVRPVRQVDLNWAAFRALASTGGRKEYFMEISMKKMLFLAATMTLLLTACNKEENKTPPVADESTAAPAVTPVDVPTIQYADALSQTFAVDKFNSQVGELVDGKLANNGKAGYLLFGPYVAFQSGTYTVAFKGTVDALPAGEKIRLDVVSGKGKVAHGGVNVDATGELSGFDVNITENVSDLEVRAFVPQDSKVVIESYQVNKKI